MIIFTEVAKVEKSLLMRSVEEEQPMQPIPGGLFVVLPPRVRPSWGCQDPMAGCSVVLCWLSWLSPAPKAWHS